MQDPDGRHTKQAAKSLTILQCIRAATVTELKRGGESHGKSTIEGKGNHRVAKECAGEVRSGKRH
jgi:hypothetical protein